MTAFVDRPAESFESTKAFWQAVTETTLSASRGEVDQFATLVPAAGDAYLRLQRVQDGRGGSHLDLHVDDVGAAAEEAIGLGATQVADLGGVVVLRSPGGLVFCCVAHHGEAVPPPPVIVDGARAVVDQLSIDVAPDRFDLEYEFWATLTGWQTQAPRSGEFRALGRPSGMPLRLLFQRRGPADAGLDATCHLDLACDDLAVTEQSHVAFGATVSAHRWWTVMADPAGIEYCLTPRSPDTGLPPA